MVSVLACRLVLVTHWAEVSRGDCPLAAGLAQVFQLVAVLHWERGSRLDLALPTAVVWEMPWAAELALV